MAFGPPTPVLRIFDEAKAREFYCEFLGFSIDWEHRFGENFPLYMQISSGSCRLHLSEHYGNSSPGMTIRIETPDVDGFRRRTPRERLQICQTRRGGHALGQPGDAALRPVRQQADLLHQRARGRMADPAHGDHETAPQPAFFTHNLYRNPLNTLVLLGSTGLNRASKEMRRG